MSINVHGLGAMAGPILLGPMLWIGCTGPASKPATTDRVPMREALVGGPFENREFTWYGIPRFISPIDTSPGWKQEGRKLLITGRVLHSDGKTPARDVLLYYYHTDTSGHYATDPKEPRNMPPNELGQSHGFIRGWVKTDSTGRYAIHTVRPGTYPTRDAPAHIHATIKEPNGINEYYIDDFVFDDDPLLDTKFRVKLENRCGSGVLRLAKQDDQYIGERDIILGLNIPDHPSRKSGRDGSGIQVGEDVMSFMPYHAWGPDAGTRTCPICKYGWYSGVLYFVGDHPDRTGVNEWLTFLEAESRARRHHLKAYFIDGRERGYGKARRERELAELGRSLGLEHVALTFVPSLSDTASEVHLNRVDPSVKNTFVVYRRSRVVASFVDLEPTEENFDRVRAVLDRSNNAYFELPRPDLH